MPLLIMFTYMNFSWHIALEDTCSAAIFGREMRQTPRYSTTMATTTTTNTNVQMYRYTIGILTS